MRSLDKLCAIGLACLTMASAQAGVVTYHFTATIKSLNEDDPSAGGFPSVGESTLPGFLIKVGDNITGRLRYDTAATLSDFQPAGTPTHTSALYRIGAGDFLEYTIGRAGFTFSTDPALRQYGYFQVVDTLARSNDTFGDAFVQSVVGGDAAFLRNADIYLGNDDGTAFDDASMPRTLDPARFQRAVLRGGFTRRSDNAWAGFEADLTLARDASQTVPEPAAPALLAVGVAMLGLARRRKGIRGRA